MSHFEKGLAWRLGANPSEKFHEKGMPLGKENLDQSEGSKMLCTNHK